MLATKGVGKKDFGFYEQGALLEDWHLMERDEIYFSKQSTCVLTNRLASLETKAVLGQVGEVNIYRESSQQNTA